MTIDDIAARHKYTGDHFGLPWSVGPHGSDVWCQSLKGGETRHIDVRGWGYLTGQGHGAMGLSADEAMALQAQLAHRVVNSVNDVPVLLAEITRLTAALADAEARGRLATTATPEMIAAYRGALKAHIESIPNAHRVIGRPGRGFRVDEKTKARIRIEAVLRAIAQSPEDGKQP